LNADDGCNEDSTLQEKGEWNGLDFMLLYNLYWLVGWDHGGQFETTYKNLHVLDTNNDIITSGDVYLKGPIDLVSKIHGSNKVYIRSDTEINLLPGFEAEVGSDIFLDVAPIDGCNYRSY